MLYQGEGCLDAQSCDDDILERIVGNPIYNYQMLKRLLVHWKKLEEEMKNIDTKRKFRLPMNNEFIHNCRGLVKIPSPWVSLSTSKNKLTTSMM